MTYHFVPWNSMEHSMEFHGTLVPPNDIPLSSMEFHGTFHGIPWNFGAAKWHITQFRGIPWNFDIVFFMAFYPGWTSKWYSMEFQAMESSNKKSPSSMGFHGIKRAPLQMTQIFHGIPWNIPNDTYHLVFHGIPWNFGAAKWSIISMELHGTMESGAAVGMN